MATRGKKSAGRNARSKSAQGNGSKKSAAAVKKTATAPAKAAGRNERNAAAVASTNGTGEFDLAFLTGLIDAIDKSGVDSVEIDREGTKVRISKTPPLAPIMQAPMHAPMMHAPATPAPAMSAPSAAPAAAAPAEAVAPKNNYTDVKSPMVGTFYRAPAPEAPSYVEIGSHVTKGQTLCILEAMKLMNELESEVDGVVREILVDNTDPVEYGQVLFRIEPASR